MVAIFKKMLENKLFIYHSNLSLMVRLGIEFLELELNSYSNCEFRGKKLCLDVEFLD
jgi:hypothetical protein